MDHVRAAASLLGVDAAALGESMTYQTLTARGQSYKAQLNCDRAAYARDALSKVMLSLWLWLLLVCVLIRFIIIIIIMSVIQLFFYLQPRDKF